MKYSHSFTAHGTNTLKRTKRIKYGKVHVFAVKLQDMILNPRGWEVCFFYHIQLQYNHLWQQFTCYLGYFYQIVRQLHVSFTKKEELYY